MEKVGTDSSKDVIMQLSLEGVNPEKGLGEELFLQISSLVPIVNVDLLVYNSQRQFLLTKRDDPHCGKGWHIPGGCIRFKESCVDRIRKVAKNELGIDDLVIEKEPVHVFEIIEREKRPIANQNERAHFITLVYRCMVEDSFRIDNNGKTEEDAGFIKWFDRLPEDLLRIQECYRELIK